MNTSEQALISCIAQEPQWTLKHAHQLSTVLFEREENKIIFEAILECGSDWDLVKIVNVLRSRQLLDKIGGAATVSDLFAEFAPIPSHRQYHLERVREQTVFRNAFKAHQSALEKLAAVLTHGTEEPHLVLAQISEEIEASLKLPGKRLKRITSSEALQKALDEVEERSKNSGRIKGITTGFALLDKITHGMQEAHLWVIAGGPADGKSAFMQNLLESAASAGAKTDVYQLEMPIEEQALRFLASDAMLDSGNLMMGLMTHGEQMALAESVKRLKKAGTCFVNTDSASAEDIIADIEAGDARVVMLDYIQLLEVNQSKSETRELAISRIARDLKRVAKRKGVTILTGSQLNDDGKLRESRAIGQHADKVLMVERVEVDGEPDMTRRNLFIAKNRGGSPMERIPMKFVGASYRFFESNQKPEEPHFTQTLSNGRKRR